LPCFQSEGKKSSAEDVRDVAQTAAKIATHVIQKKNKISQVPAEEK